MWGGERRLRRERRVLRGGRRRGEGVVVKEGDARASKGGLELEVAW